MYVYILRCEDQSLYTGIAKDVEQRFKMHQQLKGAKYTKSHKVIDVVAIWKCETRSEALRLEYAIKKLTKEKKERLICHQACFEIYFNQFDKEKYIRIK